MPGTNGTEISRYLFAIKRLRAWLRGSLKRSCGLGRRLIARARLVPATRCGIPTFEQPERPGIAGAEARETILGPANGEGIYRRVLDVHPPSRHIGGLRIWSAWDPHVSEAA